MLDYSRGMIPQRVCSVVNDPDGRPRQLCKLVNPLYLAEETVTQQLVDMPAEQLLQIDEFNEVVSNLMSNLTNQALQGLTGVLGLSGNADYSSNIFGPSGNLSYVDALVQDDIQSYQSVQGNVIKETLAVEQTYAAMQNFILSEIGDIEDEIEENNCSISLNDELEQAKNTAASNLATASTSIAILSTLDTEYDAAADASIRGSVMSTFISYRSQGLFRTEYQNRQFELTYLDITFAQMVDRFRFDHQDCITYDGVLAEEDDEDEEEEE